MKKALSIFLSLVLVVSTFGLMPFSANATDYQGETVLASSLQTGDTFEMGNYPQSRVTDEDLLTALENISCEMTSYGYMTNTRAATHTYDVVDMSYADFSYNGVFYRKVTINSYRPLSTGVDVEAVAENTYQDDNGYAAYNSYYFKWEPIVWQVLDNEEDGVYVMSQKLLDAQALNNFYESVTWENSSLRAWLNSDFYNKAFSSNEKEKINTATLVNENSPWENTISGGNNTEDNIFILSYNDSKNSSYGFSPEIAGSETRHAQGTDYAQSQGLRVDSENGNSWWLLRTRGSDNKQYTGVNNDGYTDRGYTVHHTDSGIRPAFKLALDSEIAGADVPNGLEAVCTEHNYEAVVTASTCTEGGYTTYTCSICGDTYTEYIDAAGHTPAEAVRENEVAKNDSTLTNGSYDEVVYCSVCGEEISRETVKDYNTGNLGYGGSAVPYNRSSSITYSFDSDTGILTITGSGKMCTVDDYQHKSPFYNKSVVKKVIIGEGISNITACMFLGCKLDSIELPSTLNSIGSSNGKCTDVFCPSLEQWLNISFNSSYLGNVTNLYCNNELVEGELIIPEGITSIKDYAFSGYTKISSVSCSSTVESIGKSAFSGCTNLSGITLPNALTSIGEYAFSQCSNLSEVTLSTGLNSIGAYAFYNCSKLEQVDFSSGLKSIGEYAFNKCSLLSEAILPSGLTSIGKSAFEDCKGLTDISIPSSLISIDECVFKGCSALTYVDIPGSVLSTGVGAFYNCTALKTVVLHEGLTEIGNYSFINCTSLNEVDIPNGVQTIGFQAFDGCSSITSVNIPNSVETIGSYAFRNCSSLTSIVLPNNLQKIEQYTFRDCKNLKNILIPVSVTEIASNAFYSSNAITDVYYSGTENQYNLITNVSNITPLVNATKHYNYIPPCDVHTPHEAVRENEIAPTCTEQGSYDEVVYCSVCGMELSREQKAIEALGHNYSAVVTAPTCTAQGYTTYTCTRCRDSYISDYTDTLEHTPAQAVIENEIPSTCAKKGSYDEVVYCAKCHTELSREAKEIDTLSHTAVIDEAVAPTCTQTGLTEGSHCSVCNTVIVAQQIVNALGHNWSDWQYEASTKTHSRVCINDSSHKENAACSFNQGVWVKAPTCTEKGTKKYTCTVCGGNYTEDVAALGHNYNAVNIEPSITQQGCTTYTCSRCYDSYSNNYSEYLTGYCGENVTFRLEYATGILTISGTGAMTDYENGKSVFKTSSLIKSVVIDDGVTSVGSYAFAWCTELENVSLANSVTSIGSYAFENCTSLESIDLPDNLETIGYGAFRKCTNLGGEIVIPDGISTIGYTAFFMNNMESVVIPLSVTTIEWGVFYDCASLQDVYYYGSESDWNAITIGHSNDSLNNATIHFNFYVPCDVHSPSEAVRENEIASTCTKKGSYDEVVYCSVCGEELSREAKDIDMLPHTVVTDEAVAPTCTQTGLTEGSHCSVCNTVIAAQQTVNALGHNYSAVVTKPTCTAQGYTTYTCTRCNESYINDYTDPLGHTAVTDEAVAPTCTQTGLTEGSHCSVCNTVISAQQTVNALGHNYSAVVTNPTCTAQGYTTYTCTRCNDSYISDYINAKGHTPAEAVRENEIPSTCSKKGSYDEVVYCTECNAELSREAKDIDMLPHTVVTDEAVAPTCTQTGLTEGSHCSVCNTVIAAQQTVNALGHNYSAVVTKPTCTAQGYTTYTCTRCNDSYISDYINAKGHTPAEAVRENEIPSTCAAQGSYDEVVYCTECNAELSRTAITLDLAEHSYRIYETVLPTCTSQGYTTYICNVCQDTYDDNFTDMISHKAGSAVRENEIPSTCSKKGSYDEVVYCTECHTELSRETKDIEMLAHTAVTDEAVAATCTQTGLTEGSHCSVCGKVLVERQVTPMAEHTWDDGEVIQQATSTQEGIVKYTCTVCHAVKTETIEKLAGKGKFVASNVSSKAGREISIEIYIEENPGITSLSIDVAYPEGLTLVSVTDEKLFGSGFSKGKLNSNPIALSWYKSDSSNDDSTGLFATLTFAIDEELPVGDYPIEITFDPDNIFDNEFNNVEFDVENGNVNIYSVIPGDIYQDDEINMKDIVLLQQYINRWDVEIDTEIADVNKDGKINMKDLVLIQQYINGWDVVLQ